MDTRNTKNPKNGSKFEKKTEKINSLRNMKKKLVRNKLEYFNLNNESFKRNLILKGQKLVDSLLKYFDISSKNCFTNLSKEQEIWNHDYCYVHIDMDCFFVAVEMRDDENLKDKPVAIGTKSMICTANYFARKFGVKAGQPGFKSLELCKDLILIPPCMKKYKKSSDDFFSVIKAIDPNFSNISLDEVSFDVSCFATWKNIKSLNEAVEKIRLDIFTATNGLTCSAGIGNSRMLAKLCCGINKPNGQFMVKPSESRDFILNTELKKINGLGQFSIDLMQDVLNVKTVKELLAKAHLLLFLFPSKTGINMLKYVTCTNDKVINSKKSINCSITFTPTRNILVMLVILDSLVLRIIKNVYETKIKPRNIALILKKTNFDQESISSTLILPINSVDILWINLLELISKKIRQKNDTLYKILQLNKICNELLDSKNEIMNQEENKIYDWQNLPTQGVVNILINESIFKKIENTVDCSLWTKESYRLLGIKLSV